MKIKEEHKKNILLAELKDLVLRHASAPGKYETPVKDFFLVRREESCHSSRCFAEPHTALIVQGEKRMMTGEHEFELHPGVIMVVGVDMPSSSMLLDASHAYPFLAVVLDLNRKILADLIVDLSSPIQKTSAATAGSSVAEASFEYVDAFLRLVRLLDKPYLIPILAPLIIRELYFLLLIGPQGALLQSLYMKGARDSQIIDAVNWLKKNISLPMRVEYLAKHVNMSVSSLHRHFKNITGLSPLQYHKQLRLYEAQRLMLIENERAATAALAVGYESVTQFNREYKRMFGQPPHRDINRLRGAMAAQKT